MKKVTPISQRKSDHIRINLQEDVKSGLSNGLERLRFTHQALPELDLEAVDLSATIFGKKLAAPILISSMTGGTPEAAQINATLASAAQQAGVAIGLGSQRAAIDNPDLAYTFQVRRVAPDVLLFANLGAIQLNYGYTVAECQRAVDMIEADALILHLNPLQEALQPEGDTRFAGLIKKIEAVCRAMGTPVIVKEVGWGISSEAARRLADAGVSAIDIAGAGGTSWSQVEMHRAPSESQARLASLFVDWGIPTTKSLQMVRQAAPELLLFASGGIRTGVEIAKCLALGASLGGMAGPFLKAAAQSLELTVQTIQEVRREIQVTMFATGAGTLDQLRNTPLHEV
ncbi:MAG: type 2 isopentenyl-diphosphate Delta-isomerase [Anaerolineales bacterium]|nr:type 2 isopentenyl-diphosphate Delta-isomerase [Anaerolineales bacterium]